MSDLLAATHSVVWFLFDTARLSSAADEPAARLSLSSGDFARAVRVAAGRMKSEVGCSSASQAAKKLQDVDVLVVN